MRISSAFLLRYVHNSRNAWQQPVAKGIYVLSNMYEVPVLRNVPFKKCPAAGGSWQHPVVELDNDDRAIVENAMMGLK